MTKFNGICTSVFYNSTKRFNQHPHSPDLGFGRFRTNSVTRQAAKATRLDILSFLLFRKNNSRLQRSGLTESREVVEGDRQQDQAGPIRANS